MSIIKNLSLKDIDRLFLSDACLKLGIVPIEGMSIDINRSLQSVPPDEARKMKRKFRKLWRKYAKKLNSGTSFGENAYQYKVCEFGKVSPTRRAKQARKDVVFLTIMKEEVKPKLEQFVYNKTKP